MYNVASILRLILASVGLLSHAPPIHVTIFSTFKDLDIELNKFYQILKI